jgi:predicted transposase YbfD/YdcC
MKKCYTKPIWEGYSMEEILSFLDTIEDERQHWKVQHLLKDIIVIVLFATLANANSFEEMAGWAKYHEKFLKRFIALENGIPSHDTITRVMALIKPEKMHEIQGKWDELLSRDEGETLKQILAIDGKTSRGSGNRNQEALHTVSAWSKEGGVCFGQRSSDSKGKEIPMIKELLETVSVRGQIVTIDAIGTQKEIAEKIRKGKGDYVLAVKGNQGRLYEEMKEYFGDEVLQNQITAEGNYTRTVEKARGNIEIREYWQTEDIKWYGERKEWAGLKSIGMSRNTVKKADGTESVNDRYFISSLGAKVGEFSRAVRGHWSVESMHWQLDVTFREDANRTLDRKASENLNIVRKWALSVLKMIDMGKKYSIKTKRFILSFSIEQYIEEIIRKLSVKA